MNRNFGLFGKKKFNSHSAEISLLIKTTSNINNIIVDLNERGYNSKKMQYAT
jgi:hypothetical protein